MSSDSTLPIILSCCLCLLCIVVLAIVVAVIVIVMRKRKQEIPSSPSPSEPLPPIAETDVPAASSTPVEPYAAQTIISSGPWIESTPEGKPTDTN